MTNIELFNAYTGTVLGSLYEEFPVPAPLNSRSLAFAILGYEKSYVPNFAMIAGSEVDLERADPNTIPVTPTQIYTHYSSIAHYTIKWLLDCDYIRMAGDEPKGSFDESRHRFVLSPKALEVLSMVPESLQSTQSYGSKLAEASKELATEAGKSTVTDIVGKVITTAISLFSG